MKFPSSYSSILHAICSYIKVISSKKHHECLPYITFDKVKEFDMYNNNNNNIVSCMKTFKYLISWQRAIFSVGHLSWKIKFKCYVSTGIGKFSIFIISICKCLTFLGNPPIRIINSPASKFARFLVTLYLDCPLYKSTFQLHTFYQLILNNMPNYV